MVNIKTIFFLVYDRACSYNLFVPDEDDYDDDDDEPENSAVALQRQKYATRLYVLLLTICLYMLFYATLVQPQVRTVVISNIDLNQFEQLHFQYGDLLSCPCSTITTSYKTFISNRIHFHSVCSSFFVSQQWIEAMYLLNRSSYGPADFRTTAASQVDTHVY